MDGRFALLLASGNPAKVREVRQILGPLGVDVVALGDQPELAGKTVAETGATFVANALIKARWCGGRTGTVAVADDSGLCVDALDGAPGVRSARYAGEEATDAENNARVLAALAGLPAAARTARFVCAAVLFVPAGADPGPFAALVARAEPGSLEVVEAGVPVALEDGIGVAFSGVLEGVVLEAPRGSNGFGYDPLFFLPTLGRTTAELEAHEKNALSHRGQAFRALAQAIRSLTAPGGS